jgi:hypothetical protein
MACGTTSMRKARKIRFDFWKTTAAVVRNLRVGKHGEFFFVSV